MRKKYFYNLLYFCIFSSLVVPLILNIKINEISNKIIEVNNDILILERERNYKKRDEQTTGSRLKKTRQYAAGGGNERKPAPRFAGRPRRI